MKRLFDAKEHVCDHDNLEIANQVPKDFKYDFQNQRRLSGGTPTPIRITVDYSDLDNASNGAGMSPSVKAYLIQITETVKLFFSNSLKVIPRTTPITKFWTGQCIDMNVPASLVTPGGKCYCLPGYAGSDCSISCISPNVWDGSNCISSCPNGTYLNSDNVCRANCYQGQFADITSKKCLPCDFKCSQCTGPSNNQCLACVAPYQLSNNTCQSSIVCYSSCLTCNGTANNQCLSCNPGFYLTAQNECLACQAPCANCINTATKCLSCTPAQNYTFDSSNNSCSLICDSSCKTCSLPNSSNSCLSCNNGYYLNASNQCQQCQAPCGNCIDSSTKCLSCTPAQNYTFDSSNNSCNLICDSSCKTCSLPNNSSSCLSCNNGYYLNASNQCQLCQAPCGNCIDSSTKCLSCIPVQNYTFDSSNNSCNLICDTSCKTCSLPNNSNSCLSCNNGYYLNASNQCLSCQAPCGNCIDSPTKCLSCTPAQNYTFDSSSNSCNLKCDSSCKTCSLPNNSSSCLSCNNGYYLNASNQCQQCQAPCGNCIDSSTKCLSCTPAQNYTFDSSNNSCNLICDSSCKTCSLPNSSNSCLSCNNGYYLNASNQCQQCQAPCGNCIDSPTKCLSCTPAQNYTFDSSNNSCNLICDSSCKTCLLPNNSNSCQSCNNGYYLNASNQCQQCQAPCGNCIDSPTKCLSCTPAQNYTFDSSSNSCYLKCDSSCKTCSLPNNSSSCLSCNNGYYLNASNQCQQCQAPCGNCIDSSTKCLSCTPAQNYTFDSSNNSCNLICDSSCKTCSLPNSSNSCLSCNNGYYLNASNQCQQCQAPCGNCIDSSTKCLSCTPVQNYTFDSSNNSCNLICDTSCKTCSLPNNSNSCLSCNNGYYLNASNQCLPCQAPCGNCIDSPTKCLSCTPAQNYTFDSSSNSCNLKCDSSCKTCSLPNNSSSCLSCNNGYYLNASNQCQQCQAPCGNCIDSSTKCLSCTPAQNYTFDSSNNSCNLICDSSCKTCSLPNNSNSCLSCNNGYYLNASNQCQQCQAPCGNCIDQPTKCLSCTPAQNYTFDSSNNSCNIICDSSCKTCSLPNNSNSCLSCNNGYYLNASNQCLPCQAPCGNCIDSHTKCLSCTPAQNYTFDSSNNSCNLICDSSCKTCSLPNNSSSCLSCNNGYYLNASNQCLPCQVPCGNCIDSPTKCLSCTPAQNYTFDSSNNSCNIICDSSCKTCSQPNSSNNCLSCNNGYYLNATNQCQQCQAPCGNCIDSATKCLSCTSSQNYTFDSSNNSCNLICDSSCKTCSLPNNQNSCLSCNNGYYLNASNQCLPCQAPCGNCIDSPTKCLSCTPAQNYTFDSSNNSCNIICDSSCKTCSQPNSSNNCLSCNNGYYLNATNQCQQCQAPCGNCVDSATKCLSCTPSQNYTFDSSNSSCNLICDSSCKTCSLPNNQNSCLSCNNGYYLNASNQCQQCQAPCGNCIDSSTKCLSCTPAQNYIFDSSNNSCNLICDSSCKTCSLPNNSSSCLSCNNGYYLNASNQCLICQVPCGNCIDSSTKCLSCTPAQNYTFDSSNNSCSVKCDSSCKTCSLPNNSNSCLSCNNGYYLNASNQCLPCQAPCGNCIDSPTKCLSCTPAQSYTFDSSNNSCNSICDSSCKTCSLPNNSSSCLSCNNGYYLNASNQCQQCQVPCGNCIDSPTKCLSCTPAQNYTFDSSNNSCNLKCDSSCKTCSLPNNSSSCLSCNNGQYLNASNQCQQCQAPCGNCIDSPTKCLSCTPAQNYTFDSSNNSCSVICDSSCKTCSLPNNSSSCLSCNNGYYLNASNQCLPCQAPCGNCIDSPTKCLSCTPAQSYTFDSSNNSCNSICDSSCKTCSLPNNSSSCLSCNNGYYLNPSNQCQQCQVPCGNCIDSPTKCLTCTPAQNYTFDSSNNSCNVKCDSSCKTCSLPNNSSSCLSCNNGQYLNASNQCLPCQAPCGNCIDSPTKCLSCTPAQNYTFDSSNNSCSVICDSSCKTCSIPNNSNSCLSCNNGYYLNASNQCLTCQVPCGNCIDSSTKCLSCTPAQNYTFDSSNNSCSVKCDSSCKTCSLPNNSNSCLSCNNGYYLNASNQCLPCQAPCGNCIDSPTKCLSCTPAQSYTFDSSNNSCNSICDSSCKTCSLPNNSSSCLSCNNGYYLNTSNQCQQCQVPCGNCIDSPTKCLSCTPAQSYTFDSSNNSCNFICDSSCKTCSLPNNSSRCLSCNNGYYLNASNQCQQCQAPCGNCIDQPTKCLSCTSAQNYTFDSSNNSCNLICDSSCKTCSLPNNSSSCLSCNTGYYLNALNQCKPCQLPCGDCTTLATKCLSCTPAQNYNYDSSNNSCNIVCDLSCKTCSQPNSSNSCLSCNDGYYLNASNQCLPCQAPCGNCIDSAMKCLSCTPAQNYTLDLSNNKCTLVCDSSCKTCSLPNNQNSCLSCNNGYYLNSSNQCQPCQAPCGSCITQATKCLSCYPAQSYIYNSLNNSCTSLCDPSCNTCSLPNNSNSCLSCYSGYYLNSLSQCQPCQAPCGNCIDLPTKCLSCTPAQNYSFDNSNYICNLICDSSCKTCSQANDSNSCLSCNSGYYLNSQNQCQPCKAPCGSCIYSSTKCLSCIPAQNYKFDSSNNSCSLICDSSCQTCSQPQDNTKCLSCAQNSYLLNGKCIPCGDGYYLSNNQCQQCGQNCKICSNQNTCQICQNGYELDSKNMCVTKQNTCHYTCKTCQDSSYSSCFSCVENRVLQITYYNNVGQCVCPKNTSDINQPICDSSQIQNNLKISANSIIISSAASTSLLAIVSLNPMVLFSLIEFSQTISFFTYVNYKPALGLDSVVQDLYYAHLTKVFQFDQLVPSQSSSRILQAAQNTQSFTSGNSKIPLNDKYPYFLANSILICSLTVFVWFISYLASFINSEDNDSFMSKLKRILFISLPIIVFILTSQEFSLLIFFQFLNFGFSDKYSAISSSLSLLVALFMVLFTIYLTYKVQIQKVLCQKNTNILVKIKQNKVSPIEFISNPKNDYSDLYKFLILSKYIRQDTFLQRNFILIILFRKIISSLIIVYGYQNPTIQMSLLLSNYFVYWLYIVLVRPFKLFEHVLSYSIIETVTLTMHIIYLLLIQSDGDPEKQKLFSFIMIILVILTVGIYFIISLVFLFKYIYQCLKKDFESQEQKLAPVYDQSQLENSSPQKQYSEKQCNSPKKITEKKGPILINVNEESIQKNSKLQEEPAKKQQFIEKSINEQQHNYLKEELQSNKQISKQFQSNYNNNSLLENSQNITGLNHSKLDISQSLALNESVNQKTLNESQQQQPRLHKLQSIYNQNYLKRKQQGNNFQEVNKKDPSVQVKYQQNKFQDLFEDENSVLDSPLKSKDLKDNHLFYQDSYKQYGSIERIQDDYNMK
ncbi:hypothetical protein ABPG73_009847 [Tetrahymena malaccensis]